MKRNNLLNNENNVTSIFFEFEQAFIEIASL